MPVRDWAGDFTGQLQKDTRGCDCFFQINMRRYNERFAPMDSLTLFGLFAVTAMLVFYALEKRSHWFVLAFAAACLLGSTYGFLQGAWPFGLVEAVWSVIAVRRWWAERRDWKREL